MQVRSRFVLCLWITLHGAAAAIAQPTARTDEPPVGSPTVAQYTDYTPHTSDEIALIGAENRWCEAAIKRDKATLEDVFADDLVWLTSKRPMTKAEAIADYMTGEPIFSIHLTGVVIRVYNDSAVVTGYVHVRYQSKGKVVNEIHPSTDVFIKRQGRWRLVSS